VSIQAHTPVPINFSYASPQQPPITRSFIRSVERLTGQRRLKRLYEQYCATHSPDTDFFAEAIRLLDLKIDVERSALDQPLPGGPIIFIANHPYGVLDGIVFTWLTQQMRPDTKVMANSVLCRAPQARPHLLPVDFDGTRESIRTNLETRQSALRILKSDGAIGIFPAGGVAASSSPLKGPAVDPEWSSFLAKMVRQSGASVVPIYFAGQNSRLFQMTSHVSTQIRLALYFRETRRLMGKSLRVAIGEPITQDTLSLFKQKTDLTEFLRKETYQLATGLGLAPKHIQPPLETYKYPKH